MKINLTSPEAMTHFWQSVALATFAFMGLSVAYLMVEPSISRSQATDQFTISQAVTSEISFVATAADVTMNTSIPGITGGTANGSTQVRVYTNDASGYTMTIAASSSPALQGNSQGGSIADYTPASANVPDYTHSVGANTGEFAYTVSASTTSDLAQKFLDNGSDTCNTGSADTSGSATCWYGLSTTATSTINRLTETAASGATTTIFFRTQITSNPSPLIPEDTYVATTTLTATTN
jgi:hypothetical protein